MMPIAPEFAAIKQIHQQMDNILDEWYGREVAFDTSPIIQQIKSLENFSFHKNRHFVLWDHKKFLPIYLSDNISKFGYTPKEVYKMSLFTALKRVYWQQLPAVVQIHRYGEQFRKLSNNSPLKNHQAFFSGVKIKNRKGELITFFVKQKFLVANKKQQPLLSFLEVEEIGHLLKTDISWVRMIDTSRDILTKRVYFYKNRKSEANELFSNRELTILNLIVQNKSNLEISALLEISPETIKKHRKNMIAKVGAKDMTALIHLSRLSEVI